MRDKDLPSVSVPSRKDAREERPKENKSVQIASNIMNQFSLRDYWEMEDLKRWEQEKGVRPQGV